MIYGFVVIYRNTGEGEQWTEGGKRGKKAVEREDNVIEITNYNILTEPVFI